MAKSLVFSSRKVVGTLLFQKPTAAVKSRSLNLVHGPHQLTLSKTPFLCFVRTKVTSPVKGKEEQPLNPDFVKHVTIQTCGPLYSKWSQERKPGYLDAPREGLTLEVEYYDTKELAKSDKAPVVLCLHGAPGSYRDYRSLINYLSPKGVRLVIPNFPDYSILDKTKFFRHSVHERREFILDFLKTLNINSLDTLVTHSSSAYPSLQMYSSLGFPMKSIALISTPGFKRAKAMSPSWYVDTVVELALNPIPRFIFRKVGKVLFKIFGSAVRSDNIDNLLVGATSMYLSEFEAMKGALDVIREKKPRFLFIFGSRDKLVQAENSYDVASVLGVEKSQYFKYNSDGELIQQNCHEDDWVKVIEFVGGGHYSFQQFSSIVNPEIEKLIHQVTSKKSN